MLPVNCYLPLLTPMVRFTSFCLHFFPLKFIFFIASTLCSLVGYGNVAGFLFHKGFFSAPSGSSNIPRSTSSGETINPITGTTMKPTEGVEMSAEEKEREVDKLFVLFDRLEKTGAIQPEQNPMRKALQQRHD